MNGSGGRKRNVSGTGTGMGRRGSGLGTGPVGRPGGYSGRQGGGTGGTGGGGGGGDRGFNLGGSGGGKLLLIIIAIVVLIAGTSIGSCFGCQNSACSISDVIGGITDISGGGGGISDLLSGFGGFMGSGSTQSSQQPASVSSGWIAGANTGVLNKNVDPSARAKYTTLKKDGTDKVTLMVYLCGADLETKSGMASKDLQEMAAATFSENVHLLVYTGGASKWHVSGIRNDVNQIFEVRDGKLISLVSNDGTDSMTKPATLTRFIKYCADKYPANRYGLVMWDHGGGTVSGFGYDELHQSSGSMPLNGISNALKNAGVKFDFVGFDACLMATLENGLMLNDYADYLIASEETEPGVGWYHTNWISELSKNPAISTPELGKVIIDDYTEYCARNCSGQKTTLSVIDLAELSATIPDALKDFAEKTTSMIQNDQYKTVSDARASTREFSSNKIDQVDLVHFAYNLNTASSKALAQKILSAVKYNRTSSNMTNAHGLSAYFPYRNSSKVSSGVSVCESVGVDDEYIKCLKSFASVGTGGQAVAEEHTSSAISSILGSFTGGGTSSSSAVTSILGGLLGGGDSGSFFSSLLDMDKTSTYLTANQFDSANLFWTQSGGIPVMNLPTDQWKLVQELQLNVFYDDGEGYVDLGCDSWYEFTSDGKLRGDVGNSWIAIGTQVVPYYYIDTTIDGGVTTYQGRIPCLLNGDRAELLVVFTEGQPSGSIVGARYVYANGETDTVAKAETELQEGDKIDFVCDFYSYEGVYQDSYLWGEELVYTGNEKVNDVAIDRSKTSPMYIFTDLYGNEFFSPVIPN